MLVRLRAWYRHDDQELLRREVRWTLRWLRGPWGIAFLGLYAITRLSHYLYYLPFGPFPWWAGETRTIWQYRESLIVWANGWRVSAYTALGSVSPEELVLAGSWGYLMLARTFRPFAKGNLRDILVSGAESKRPLAGFAHGALLGDCNCHGNSVWNRNREGISFDIASRSRIRRGGAVWSRLHFHSYGSRAAI